MHLVPYFGERSLHRIDEDDVTRLMVRLRRSGRSPKTIRNVCSTLHSLFELAVRRRWAATNPCKSVDLPEVPPNRDIRFLNRSSFNACCRRVSRPATAQSSNERST